MTDKIRDSNPVICINGGRGGRSKHVALVWFEMYRVRHKSVNTPLRHKSVNTPLSHELRARSVQQAVRGIKSVNRLMPHPVL